MDETMKDGMILLEEGAVCTPNEFWLYRHSQEFDNGLKQYERKIENNQMRSAIRLPSFIYYEGGG